MLRNNGRRIIEGREKADNKASCVHHSRVVSRSGHNDKHNNDNHNNDFAADAIIDPLDASQRSTP